MEIRVIKRYSNRRLYDSFEKKTITLEDIAELVKSDVDFKVIDNKTGNDVTIAILSKVLSGKFCRTKRI